MNFIGENIIKNLSGKYSQNFLDNAKQSAADTLKAASKTVIQKTVEANGDLIGNKIVCSKSMFKQQTEFFLKSCLAVAKGFAVLGLDQNIKVFFILKRCRQFFYLTFFMSF